MNILFFYIRYFTLEREITTKLRFGSMTDRVGHHTLELFQ